MVTYAEAIILAIVQGVTEWLPISSSAHLALLQKLMGISPPVAFDIALHVGTLLSVLVYFSAYFFSLIKNTRMVAYIIIASIPTAIIGFTFHDFFASFFSDIRLVGIALLITGIFLYITKFAKESKPLDSKSSFLIGIAQGIAVAPGISRSGATIGTGMLLGIKGEDAARFSFLISIPAVAGAAFFELRNAPLQFTDAGPTILGVIIASIVGYAAIGFLFSVLRQGRLSIFAYYCWLVGTLAIIWGLLV